LRHIGRTDTKVSERIEDQIRDQLVERLDLIAPGLRFLEKEVSVQNPLGASGEIDILARDSFEQLVVIELKRSDASARQALHELLKYVGLLKRNYQVHDDQLRVILLSTHWHELLVPFSEYVHQSTYHVEGRQLHTDSQHTPLRTEPIQVVPIAPAIQWCPVHIVYLYTEQESRLLGHWQVSSELAEVGVEDFFSFFMNYEGEIPQIMYPYADYLVLSEVPLTKREAIQHALGITDADVESGDEGSFEEQVVAHVNRLCSGSFDSLEIGYPEKFEGLRQQGWTTIDVNRRGVVESEIVYPHSELNAIAGGVKGQNSVIYQNMLSPAFAPAWRAAQTHLANCLSTNPTWLHICRHYLREVETLWPGASVALQIYNPANFLMSLYYFAAEESVNYLPSLEIVVDAGDTHVAIVRGFLSWDRKTVLSDPQTVIQRVFGDMDTLLLAIGMHDTGGFEQELVSAHGLGYEAAEISGHTTGVTAHRIRTSPRGAVLRSSVSEKDLEGFDAFARAHADYLRQLCASLRSRMKLE
jgi:hypothetical protein